MSSAVLGNAITYNVNAYGVKHHIAVDHNAVDYERVNLKAVERAAAPRLRITARGRAVLTAIVALPIVVAALYLSLGGGAAIANGAAGAPLETVTVLSGQTLWQVAEEVAPQADPREVIADLLNLNSLESAEVFAGQRLEIPREYSH